MMRKKCLQWVLVSGLFLLAMLPLAAQQAKSDEPTDVQKDFLLHPWHNRVTAPPSPETVARQQQFDLLVKAAQDLLKAGKYSQAEVTFNQALGATLDKTGWDTDCLEGLAAAYTADGQTDKAIAAYASLYSPPNSIGGSFLSDDETILQYALLLSQAGQSDKAITVYNYAIKFRNYEDGEQNVPFLFPQFGAGIGQTPYNASLLQAMAHASISTRKIGFDDAAATSHAQQAAALVPNNLAVQFYLASCLQNACRDADGKPLSDAVRAQNRAAAKAAYQKAVALGGDIVTLAIKRNGGTWALAQ